MVISLMLIRLRRNEIEALADQFGARNIRVFGPTARGEFSVESELDLLVDFETRRSLLDLVGFEQDLSEMLGCVVNVVSSGVAPPWEGYFKDAVPL